MEALSHLENVHVIEAPSGPASLTSWTGMVKDDYNIQSTVSIDPVNEELYLVKYRHGSNELLFFSNQDDQTVLEFTAVLNTTKKTAWCWNPETGERYIYPAAREGELEISLQPLESILIVLDDKAEGESLHLMHPDEGTTFEVGSAWNMQFMPVHHEPFELETKELFEFGNHKDRRIADFAGKVYYQTSFEVEDADWAFLDLGIEKHVTEVKLNGKPLGVRWWGRHLFRIEDGQLAPGENKLEILYTNTLANYVNSLKDNEVAMNWIRLSEPDPMGLTGEVRLLKKK